MHHRNTCPQHHRSAASSIDLSASKHITVKLKNIEAPIATDVEPYNLASFIDLRDRLNVCKSQLDPHYTKAKSDRDFARRWYQFQNMTDTYKTMRARIMKTSRARHVTNAWMKYWEIYSQYSLISPLNDELILAFFNAELPGAALCAFNHYMKTVYPQRQFDWRASSLAPGGGALGDDYGLYEKNKDKWLMDITGQNNNGDVTKLENILDFATRIGPNSEWGGVHFYSHDAGIDVSKDFNAQETANAQIHLGCALAGLLALRPGGSFIAKQYTLFETFTWHLILIYAQCFETFYLCKPVTSRPYNSEIYLVGQGFIGVSDKVVAVLSDRLQNFHLAPFISREAVGSELIENIAAITDFARQVFGQQISHINLNVKLFQKYQHKLEVLRRLLKTTKIAVIAEWMKTYYVPAISSTDQLPSR